MYMYKPTLRILMIDIQTGTQIIDIVVRKKNTYIYGMPVWYDTPFSLRPLLSPLVGRYL